MKSHEIPIKSHEIPLKHHKIPLNHYNIPVHHRKIPINHHKIPWNPYKIPRIGLVTGLTRPGAVSSSSCSGDSGGSDPPVGKRWNYGDLMGFYNDIDGIYSDLYNGIYSDIDGILWWFHEIYSDLTMENHGIWYTPW